MKALRIVGVLLVVAGILGLIYGGFSYPKDTQDVTLGPVELTLTNTQSVALPVWASVVAIGVGVALLDVPWRGWHVSR